MQQDDWGVGQDDWGDENDSGVGNDDDDIMPDSSDANEGLQQIPTEHMEAAEAAATAEQLEQMTIEDDEEVEGCLPEDIITQPTCDLRQILHTDSSQAGNSESSDSVTFKSFFIAVIEEPLENSVDLRHEQKLLKEYTYREGVDLEELMCPVGYMALIVYIMCK